ncbi:MAG: SRPBCC family protein [Bacteroidales bacterium]
MKALKTIGIVVLVIIALVVVISLFLPRKVHVERSLVINSNSVVVFDQVNTLKNWENWSPWHNMDTAMDVYYIGPQAGPGAIYHWSSKNPDVGTGKMTITKSVKYDTITLDLDFTQNTAICTFYVIPDGENVKVIWGIDANMGRNPLKRYLGLFMEKWIGPDFEKGLQNLKEYVEKLPYSKLKVEPATITETYYISIRDTSTMAEIGNKMGEFYGELMGYLGKKKIQAAGPPFCLYYTWENDMFDLEACIPVAGQIPVEGRIKSGVLKAGNVIKTDFYGPYEKSGYGHEVVMDWITKNDKKVNGAPWEVYMNDPVTEKDPNKLLTVIYWPVE